MVSSHVQLLYQEYIKTRNVSLTHEQFLYFVNLYPALIVCMSDGKLDDNEWESVLSLVNTLADEFSMGDNKEELRRIFRTEFRYLLDNVDKWRKKFLNALKDQLSKNGIDKEFVLESMYLFANSADGISEIEQNTINELSKRLVLDH